MGQMKWESPAPIDGLVHANPPPSIPTSVAASRGTAAFAAWMQTLEHTALTSRPGDKPCER